MTTAPRVSQKPLKIGVVGAGTIGQLAHLSNYAAIDSCQIVALSELRSELRQRVGEKFGIPKQYSQHLELLDDPEVEAVVAVTARPMTGPIALDCLQAGKHLITEKPMAATADQAERLVQAARSTRVHYTVGYMRRHDAGVQLAKRILDELVATQELGPITFVRAHCFQGEDYCNIDGQLLTSESVPEGRPVWPLAPEWIPEKRQRDYAWFLNVYCHTINLLRYLLGSTPKVDYARMDHNTGRVVVLDFGEHLAVLEAGGEPRTGQSWGWDEYLEIFFTHGRLRIELPPGLLRNMPAQIELYKGGRHQRVRFPEGPMELGFPSSSGSICSRHSGRERSHRRRR